MLQIAGGPHGCGLPLNGARPLRRHAVLVCSKKGFGPAKKAQDVEKKRKPTGKVRRGEVQQPVGPQRVPGALTDLQLRRVDELAESSRRVEDEADFLQRLETVKLEGREKKAVAAAAAAAGVPAAAAARPQGAIFDPPPQGAAAPMDDIYASPPTLAETLMDKMNSDISDPALRKAAIGPDKIGLAVGALALGVIIVLVSGADFSPGTDRYKGVRPTKPLPDDRQAALLEAQAASFRALLEKNPDDESSLEGLAVTLARLGDYDAAANLLDKLVAKRPGDAEALRVLGEASLLSAQPARAVAAYEKAIAIEGRDQQILTGLTDAYIASGQQSKAVARLIKLRDELAAGTPAAAAAPLPFVAAAPAAPAMVQAPPLEAGAEAGGGGGEGAAAAAEAAPAQPAGGSSGSGGGSGSGASRPARSLDPVAVQLLLGKTYAGWRGHDTDALAAYDALVRSSPEDFRGYLAKGIFLKERGRRGDAERMFLQAKFFAPDSMKAFVAARAGENVVVDLPDNNS